jgi:hypothetical protein
MTVIDNIRSWLATDASDAERATIDRQLNPPGGALAAINSVVITGPQLRAGIGSIEHIQIRGEADMVRHGMILSAFAQEYGFTPIDYAGAALHARAVALDRWCNLHDPYGQTDVEAFFEAGARAPLIETPEGMAFEPKAFGELVTFLAELPF